MKIIKIQIVCILTSRIQALVDKISKFYFIGAHRHTGQSVQAFNIWIRNWVLKMYICTTGYKLKHWKLYEYTM